MGRTASRSIEQRNPPRGEVAAMRDANIELAACPRCKGTGAIKEADRPRLTAASYMAGVAGPAPCRMCRGAGKVWFKWIAQQQEPTK